MKKIILIFTLAIISLNVFSQGLSYGIKGGLNYSKISGNTINADYRQGFHAGVYAKLSALVVAVQPEILFSQKGYDSESSGTETHARLNYIDIPLVLKIHFIPILSFDIGPQYSILVSQVTKAVDASGNTTTSKSTAALNQGELGGLVGASVQILKFGVGARYCFGLQDAVKNVPSTKNNLFQVYASFKL